MKLETIAVHAGKKPEEGSRAITSSIQLATTFERAADGTFPQGYIYARSNNPNRKALETCLAALEGGACAAAFSSGSAASMAVFQALSPGDHIIAPLDIYWGTTVQLREILQRWGLKVSAVDMSDPREVEEAMTPQTRLLWVETPSNPLLKIVDIERMVAIGHRVGAIVACDNTWGTPVLQRPLELGVDVVMHSTTKYLGGHSDVIGGALISKEEDDFFRRIRAHSNVWRRRTLSVRLLADPARGEHARLEGSRAIGTGFPGGEVSGRTSEGGGRPLSRFEESSRTRGCQTSDDALWRHAGLSSKRGPGRSHGSRCQSEDLYTRHQSGRSRKPH